MKRDKVNGNISKQSYWLNNISCWKKSGLTQRQYCLSRGLSVSTFSYWMHKLEKESERSNPPRFYPMTIKDSSPSDNRNGFHTGVRLSLCNDKFKIDLGDDFSETTLKKLITTLETI